MFFILLNLTYWTDWIPFSGSCWSVWVVSNIGYDHWSRSSQLPLDQVCLRCLFQIRLKKKQFLVLSLIFEHLGYIVDLLWSHWAKNVSLDITANLFNFERNKHLPVSILIYSYSDILHSFCICTCYVRVLLDTSCK